MSKSDRQSRVKSLMTASVRARARAKSRNWAGCRHADRLCTAARNGRSQVFRPDGSDKVLSHPSSSFFFFFFESVSSSPDVCGPRGCRGGLFLFQAQVKYLKLVFPSFVLARSEFQMGKGLLYQRVFGKLSVTEDGVDITLSPAKKTYSTRRVP